MLVLSQYHIFESYKINIYSVVYFVCVCVCVSQLRNAQAIRYVLVIKLTKETIRRVWRGKVGDIISFASYIQD